MKRIKKLDPDQRQEFIIELFYKHLEELMSKRSTIIVECYSLKGNNITQELLNHLDFYLNKNNINTIKKIEINTKNFTRVKTYILK